MTNATTISETKPRIGWVDVAKGLGMFLVFYGHFVQRFIELDVPAAAVQMRWIYSFHMPLFFVLVGFVYKDRGLSFEQFLRREIRTRMVPVWTFNIIAMLIWLIIAYAQGPDGFIGRMGWGGTATYCGKQTFSLFVLGRPAWIIITWFLICLFTAEVMHFGLQRWLRSTRNLCISVCCLAVVVWLLDAGSETLDTVIGPRRHWWLATPAVAALMFYQFGIVLRRFEWLSRPRPLWITALLTLGCLAASLATFNLNSGLTSHSPAVVLMVNAQYGTVGLFFLSAVAGTGFLIFASQLLTDNRVLTYVGQITLTLMCLNGLLHRFANPPVAGWFVDIWPEPGALLLAAICMGFSAVSLAACVPIDWAIQRYAPFLLGQAARKR